MNENINLKTIQGINNIAIYAKDISMKKIDEIIIDTHKNNPMLVELFSAKFFSELLKQLNAKKKIYTIYVGDLHSMKEEFNADISVENIVLSTEEKEYKDTLTSVSASLSILIAKLDIKIEEIQEKVGNNYA